MTGRILHICQEEGLDLDSEVRMQYYKFVFGESEIGLILAGFFLAFLMIFVLFSTAGSFILKFHLAG